jgi:hypothetical protein
VDLLLDHGGLDEWKTPVAPVEVAAKAECQVRVGDFTENPQVLDSVVLLVPVDVVNFFFGPEEPSQMAFDDQPVLGDLSAAHMDVAVGGRVRVAAGHPVTRPRAVPSFPGLGRGRIETGIAPDTANADAGKVVWLPAPDFRQPRALDFGQLCFRQAGAGTEAGLLSPVAADVERRAAVLTG